MLECGEEVRGGEDGVEDREAGFADEELEGG